MSSDVNTENCKYVMTTVPPIAFSLDNAKAVVSPYGESNPASYNFESPNPFLSKMSSPIRLDPFTTEKVAFMNMGNRPDVSSTEFIAVPYGSEHTQELSNISGGNSRFYAPKPAQTSKPEKKETKPKPHTKDTDDYIFQFYIGSLTVVGLLILFRIIRKGGT